MQTCIAAFLSRIRGIVIGVFAIVGFSSTLYGDDSASPADIEFFEKEIRPILVAHCYECHSVRSKKLQAGLRLDSRSSLLKGGDTGPAIVANQADKSLFIEAIQFDSLEMPPRGKLPQPTIDKLIRWVNMGAPWPDEPEPTAEKTNQPEFDLESRKKSHWAWQLIQTPKIPNVADSNWPRTEADHFILTRLEEAKMQPAPQADRRTLVRRLYFDIIGLPPTPEQVHSFIKDQSPDAWEHLIDRLLASPRFGERWGRHWLDLVRYAESRGHRFDEDSPNAFQYRDYVIRALNADVPYDQFVREHIAGDLLPSPRLHPTEGFNESILGTGFWFLGEWVHSPVDIRKDETDRFDNMIDVMSKTFLGLTVSCARCHDHKFDAISSSDYYSLAGFLQSSDYHQVRFESMEQNRQVATELAELNANLQQQLRSQIATACESKLERFADGVSDNPKVEILAPWNGQSAERQSLVSDSVQRRMLVDFSNIESEDYRQNGFSFGMQPRRPGDFIISNVTDSRKLTVAQWGAACYDAIWDGLNNLGVTPTRRSDRLASLPRSGRTLRTPTFELTQDSVAYLLRGKGTAVACVDSHRLLAGPLHQETIRTFAPPKSSNSNSTYWVQHNLARYQGHRLHLEFTPDRKQTVEVMAVIAGPAPKTTNTNNDGSSVANTAEIQKQIKSHQAVFLTAVKLWKNGKLHGEPNHPEYAAAIQWLVNNRELFVDDPETLNRSIQQTIADYTQQRDNLKQRIKTTSHTAMVMLDGTGEDDHVLIRGSHESPGDLAKRRFLTAIDGPNPLNLDYGSGRLHLAERINAETNPLTSRVIVNRIWHHLMGRGIVPTTDDFGALGLPPTHPELLDHLATWFDKHDRSIKKLIKYVAQSRAYQMSSQSNTDYLERDPKNLLWHHMPLRRLEGEVVRDALLAVSGNLDLTMYGESIPIHLTPFMGGRGRPKDSGPLDGGNRRTVYVAVRRNFLSPFMLAFDTPTPFSTMGRRNVSNVPAQALILMNDPFVVDQSHQWAKRAIAEVPSDKIKRIEWMYETAFARPPTHQELTLAQSYLDQQTKQSKDKDQALTAWANFAHALINVKEFVFVR